MGLLAGSDDYAPSNALCRWGCADGSNLTAAALLRVWIRIWLPWGVGVGTLILIMMCEEDWPRWAGAGPDPPETSKTSQVGRWKWEIGIKMGNKGIDVEEGTGKVQLWAGKCCACGREIRARMVARDLFYSTTEKEG